MKMFLAVVLLVPVLASAQSLPPPPPKPYQVRPFPVPPPGYSPAIGIGDIVVDAACAYPDAALRAASQGRTWMNFAVTPDGQIFDISIYGPSGNDTLDQAAVACLSNLRVNVADQPKAVGHHHGGIIWTIPASPMEGSSNLPLGRFKAGPPGCQDHYPKSAWDAKIEGATRLHFRITAEGRVQDPQIDRSSGNDDLDAAAIACVSSWNYIPAKQNGVAVETPSRVIDIKWMIPGESR